jgi:hypothetical protein
MFSKSKYCLFILIVCASVSIGQLKSIETYSTYSIALTKLNEIDKADAVGGGLSVKYEITENLKIGLEGGFKLFSISQPGQLEKFGWQFWNDRYSNTIQSNLNATELNLSVNITSTQKVDVIPVMIAGYYDFKISDNFLITSSIAGGAYFYTRRMYVVENWGKYFPEEDYTFEYSYRNFAPSKRGNPLVGKAGLDFSYQITEGFNLIAGGAYTYIIPTEGKLGYDNFIMENELEIKLGLTFNY